MVAIAPLTDAEIALLEILWDESGTELAEFAWSSGERKQALNEDFYAEKGWSNPSPPTQGRYRLFHYQYWWSACPDQWQCSFCARGVGKTEMVARHTCAYVFSHPGIQKALYAPYANQRNLLVQPIERRLNSCYMTREMLKRTGSSNGITKSPSWRAEFKNGCTIESRIPNANGDGQNGIHADDIHMDEAQAYNPRGWPEVPNTFNSQKPGSKFHCLGVTNGETNGFSERAKSSQYTTHRIMAMHHPKWGDVERQKAIDEFGGIRTSGDYMRNIYGEHNDGESPIFILSKLMNCIDGDPESVYNLDVYKHIRIDGSTLGDDTGLLTEAILTTDIEEQIPPSHLTGWRGDSQDQSKNQDWSAPKGYDAYYAGMDVGTVRDPSEIFVYGQRVGKNGDTYWDTLLRITLVKVSLPQQRMVVRTVFRIYGLKLLAYGMDKTGEGLDMWQDFMASDLSDRIWGYNFSETVPTGWLSPESVPDWHLRSDRDRQVWRKPPDFGLATLRNDMVHPGRLLLPNDVELRKEWEGTAPKKSGGGVSVSSMKKNGAGGFHTLDAAMMLACAMLLPDILEATRPEVVDHVPDDFVGAW